MQAQPRHQLRAVALAGGAPGEPSCECLACGAHGDTTSFPLFPTDGISCLLQLLTSGLFQCAVFCYFSVSTPYYLVPELNPPCFIFYLFLWLAWLLLPFEFESCDFDVSTITAGNLTHGYIVMILSSPSPPHFSSFTSNKERWMLTHIFQAPSWEPLYRSAGLIPGIIFIYVTLHVPS